MRSPSSLFSTIATMLAAVTISTSACQDAPGAVSHESLHDAAQSAAKAAKVSGVSSSTAALLKKVHAATARYHATVQATKAGYVVSSPCVANPSLGGMGYHWVKFANVDPVFNATEPEAVLYAPDAQGNLKLVAVEYIVIDVGQPDPTFGDQPFNVGGAPVQASHWTLHVWLHRDNPSGVFASFNPTVVCPA